MTGNHRLRATGKINMQFGDRAYFQDKVFLRVKFSTGSPVSYCNGLTVSTDNPVSQIQAGRRKEFMRTFFFFFTKVE